MSETPPNWLLWFGVLGGGAAWATQFVVNLSFTLAQCQEPGRFMLPVHSWEIGISAAAVVIGVSAMAVCLRLFLATYRLEHVWSDELQGKGHRPPLGRVFFLSVIGIVLNTLTLIIIVMTAIGAPLLAVCQQS
jgi:hypothetical protein